MGLISPNDMRLTGWNEITDNEIEGCNNAD